MKARKRRGGIVENILAKSRPESPLKGIRIRSSKPNFMSRAVRPGGYAKGGTVPKEGSMAKKGFGFPASTKGAGRGEGLGALMPDVPPPLPAAAAAAPPPAMKKGKLGAPGMRKAKPITALRGMKTGGAVKKFARGGLVPGFQGGGPIDPAALQAAAGIAQAQGPRPLPPTPPPQMPMPPPQMRPPPQMPPPQMMAPPPRPAGPPPGAPMMPPRPPGMKAGGMVRGDGACRKGHTKGRIV